MSLLFILALAVTPLADAEQERRAQALEREIRCVVCENEPISQSTADIAQDMRRAVRERVEAGDSDSEVRAFFRERYGDFVLLRPPIDARTWALWITPILLLGAGFAAVWSSRRNGAGGALEPEDGER